jgi:hypothetical protein
MSLIDRQPTEHIRKRLHIVRIVALVDLVLLIILVSAALTGAKDIVHVIGPLHGINFLLLLVIVGAAAIDGVWGWWFPVAVLLTAGPPGAFLGEWILRRRIKAQHLTMHDELPKEEAETPASSLLVTTKTSENGRKEHL